MPKKTTTTTMPKGKYPPGGMTGPPGKKTPAERGAARTERANKRMKQKYGGK